MSSFRKKMDNLTDKKTFTKPGYSANVCVNRPPQKKAENDNGTFC